MNEAQLLNDVTKRVASPPKPKENEMKVPFPVLWSCRSFFDFHREEAPHRNSPSFALLKAHIINLPSHIADGFMDRSQSSTKSVSCDILYETVRRINSVLFNKKNVEEFHLGLWFPKLAIMFTSSDFEWPRKREWECPSSRDRCEQQ